MLLQRLGKSTIECLCQYTDFCVSLNRCYSSETLHFSPVVFGVSVVFMLTVVDVIFAAFILNKSSNKTQHV